MGYMCTEVSSCGGGNMQKFLSEIEKYHSSQTESKEGEESLRMGE